MAGAAAIISIASAAIGAVGSLVQGAATANAAKYNAAVAERNRVTTLEQTYAEIDDRRIKQRQMIGQMRAAYGANGVEMTGSPMDVLSDTVEEMEYDNAKVRYQGKLKAQGFDDQKKLFKMEAKSAKVASYFGAASSMLGALDGAFDGGGMFGTAPDNRSLYGNYA